MFRASLHAYGGTFDSVTCHQRRYHCPRLRIVASALPLAVYSVGVCRSALIFSPPGRSASWRTRCPAPRKRNVSACPIRFSEGSLGIFPSILQKQKSGPKKRKFAKEDKRIEKEIVSDRIFGDRGTEDGKTKARGKSSSRLGKRLDFDKFIYFLFYASYI